MRVAILAAVVFLLGSPSRPKENAGAIAIVLDTSISTHVALSGALQRRLPFRTVERSPSQPWSESNRPIATITLGRESRKWAETFAPKQPHAALLRWSNEPLPNEPGAPTLVGSAHPQAACAAALLSNPASSEAPAEPLVILAAATDDEAAVLAKDFEATLVTGGLSELASRLEDTTASSVKVFVRGEPELAHPVWMRRLGELARSPRFHVGSDAPGTARFGVTQWVRRDLDAHAVAVSKWLERKIRAHARRRRRSLRAPSVTQASIPCIP
ncbi:MAG: hypothetical protein ACPHRO_03495 [Nannocystaceae bacterium]